MTTKIAAYVVRRPGTTSSPFRRTFTDSAGNAEKLVFQPGIPVGVTAEQAEFLRDDIAKGTLAPVCDADLAAPKIDEELVEVIREEYEADQQFERNSQLVGFVDGDQEKLPKTEPPKADPQKTAKADDKPVSKGKKKAAPVTRTADSEQTS